ncbi:hypothetical protein PILCRDRAFT_818986 [Piloderma croceum F 1598]|uniref:MARVEL domain-containing protein n=1 Tax=Piloderma croceum (strain F 1598) TaxID=765440 RepID=A0A0C3G068_PILCF|nr:hypothetical protein PILCRDRAFT_818986 [Piloderma croceum F 1598]
MVLYIVRVAVFVLSIVFSVIVLGLAAYLQSLTNVELNFVDLAIATAVLTIVTLPVLLIVDLIRDGAFTSMVVVELSWLFVLWVLWLATGADAAQVSSNFFSSCDFVFSLSNQICHEVQAIVGFSFLIWLLLMVYSIVILVMAIIASTRGNSPWTSTVKRGNFLAPATGAQSGGGAAHSPIMHQHQYPPTQSSGATPPPLQGSYTGAAEVSELPHEGTSYA